MIYVRSRGGEELPAAVDRAIQIAAAGNDIVELRFNGVEVQIHPNWRDTIIAFWNEKHNFKLEEGRRDRDL